MTHPKPRKTRVAAYGLIVQGPSIVLCRISKVVPQHEGSWTLPGGGLDFGEHPEDAVVREVREETGLTVRVKEVAGVDSISFDGEQRLFHAIRIIYHTELVGGELTNEINGSTDRCEWHSQTEMDQLKLVDLAEVGLRLAFPS